MEITITDAGLSIGAVIIAYAAILLIYAIQVKIK
jgi:hypothetical protein